MGKPSQKKKARRKMRKAIEKRKKARAPLLRSQRNFSRSIESLTGGTWFGYKKEFTEPVCSVFVVRKGDEHPRGAGFKPGDFVIYKIDPQWSPVPGQEHPRMVYEGPFERLEDAFDHGRENNGIDIFRPENFLVFSEGLR